MTVVQCPYCDLHLDTLQAAAMHAFKSQDDEHADADSLDAAMTAVVAHSQGDDDGNDGAGGAAVDVQDADPELCENCGAPTAPIGDVLDEREDEAGRPIEDDWRSDIVDQYDRACAVCSEGDTLVVPS